MRFGPKHDVALVVPVKIRLFSWIFFGLCLRFFFVPSFIWLLCLSHFNGRMSLSCKTCNFSAIYVANDGKMNWANLQEKNSFIQKLRLTAISAIHMAFQRQINYQTLRFNSSLKTYVAFFKKIFLRIRLSLTHVWNFLFMIFEKLCLYTKLYTSIGENQ